LLIILWGCKRPENIDEIDLNNITIAQWYDGKRCAFTFTFDDNTPKQKDIGDLLEKYNFRGSFYVNAGLPTFQQYKQHYIALINRGHEIGNHTFRHKNLVNLDAVETEFQVSKGATEIERVLGKYPLSFVHPYNAAVDPVNNIVYKYHLFSRIVSPYNLGKRKIYDINPNWPGLNEVKEVMNTCNSCWIIIAGHGYGENDVSWEFLENLCKELSRKNDLWVEPLSVIAAYDYLREELKVLKEKSGDQLLITIQGYDSYKYRNMDKLPLTVKVPVLSDNVLLTSNNPKISVNYSDSSYYFSFDLKKIKHFKILRTR
jgi:peptidoglycan/xylan/chitin deacetylase (PgdA/CDA1 family)